MQNEPDPSGPDSSTADLPGLTADPAAPAGMGLGNTINLTQEAAKSAGIMDPQIGDEYSVKIKVGDNTDGITATVMDGSAVKTPMSGDDEGDDSGEDTDDLQAGDEGDDKKPMAVIAIKKPMKKPKSRVMSPADMGISTTDGL